MQAARLQRGASLRVQAVAKPAAKLVVKAATGEEALSERVDGRKRRCPRQGPQGGRADRAWTLRAQVASSRIDQGQGAPGGGGSGAPRAAASPLGASPLRPEAPGHDPRRRNASERPLSRAPGKRMQLPTPAPSPAGRTLGLGLAGSILLAAAPAFAVDAAVETSVDSTVATITEAVKVWRMAPHGRRMGT